MDTSKHKQSSKKSESERVNDEECAVYDYVNRICSRNCAECLYKKRVTTTKQQQICTKTTRE